MELIEHIKAGEQTLAIIIRKPYEPDRTEFLTPPEYKQQVGYVVYPEGGKMARHTHRAIQRSMEGTSEVPVVPRGRCEVDFAYDDRSLVGTRKLQRGDVMLMVGVRPGVRQ